MVDSVAVLLFVTVSIAVVSDVLTVATLLKVPVVSASTVATTVIVAVAPLARFPMATVMSSLLAAVVSWAVAGSVTVPAVVVAEVT